MHYKYAKATKSRIGVCEVCNLSENFIMLSYKMAHALHLMCYTCFEQSDIGKVCLLCNDQLEKKYITEILHIVNRPCSKCKKKINIKSVLDKDKKCCLYTICDNCFLESKGCPLCN